LKKKKKKSEFQKKFKISKNSKFQKKIKIFKKKIKISKKIKIFKKKNQNFKKKNQNFKIIIFYLIHPSLGSDNYAAFGASLGLRNIFHKFSP